MSDANRTQDFALREAPFATRKQAGWLLGLLATAVVLLSLGGESARTLFCYDRAAVLEAGQYWRLVTGHLVHASIRHLALNLAGLGVIVALFPRHYSLVSWLLIGIASTAAIDAGFVWNEPQLAWYVGLSGVLNGALAAGAIAWWRFESKALAAVLSLVLIGKLAWEQTHGALPLSGDMRVIVDAHLYGALGGAIAGFAVLFGHHGWPTGTRSL